MKGVIIGVALWSALLFLSSGRLDWHRAWAAIVLLAVTLAVNGVLVKARNPELLRERWKRRRNTKPFDKVFAMVFLPALFALPVLAGLEVRLTGDTAPLWTALAGAALLVVADIPIVGSMVANPHLETTVRIQDDRGHRVVTTGPYRVVRHPMYAGTILQQTAFALLLGSAWAFVPVAVIFAALVIRTALEDSTLRAELPGYAEYARRTRYRLIPPVW
jgi:protein-S-isoprenylcysteine O-methyltransferase Ste14